MNPEEITLLDITVEEAMKLIISAGAYLPGSQVVDQLKEQAETEPMAPISTTED